MTGAATSDARSDLRAVVNAGRRLEEALQDRDRAEVRAAQRRLEEALLRQDVGGAAAGGLRFARAGAAEPDAAPASNESALDDLLVEIQLANVSLAAGALGAGVDDAPDRYAAAVGDLRRSTEPQERAGAETLRFQRRRADPAPPVASPTPAAARTALDEGVDHLVAVVVDESRTVVAAAWGELRRLPGAREVSKVVAAVERAGGSVDVPESMAGGRLVALGLRKLRAVLDALRRLFDVDVDVVRPQLERIWGALETDDLLRRALVRLYGVEEALDLRRRALAAGSHEQLDAAATAVRDLADRFAAFARRAGRLVRALAVASAVTGLLVAAIPGVNLHHVAIVAGGQLLLLGGTLLMAMDYMDARVELRRVTGVRDVLRGVAS